MPPEHADAITVQIVRPADLVALSCRFTGCDLESGRGRVPYVVPRGNEALLIVTFPFQHGHEEATYEKAPDGSNAWVPERLPSKDPASSNVVEIVDDAGQVDAPATPLQRFSPARSSRLVFELGTASVEYSTDGILAAMTRLPLRLHPNGSPPGTAPQADDDVDTGRRWNDGIRFDPAKHGRFLHLGNGVVAELRATGAIVRNVDAKVLAAQPAPDVQTLAGRMELAQNLERFRRESQRQTPIVGRDTVLPKDLEVGAGIAVIGNWWKPQPHLESGTSSAPDATQTSIEAPFRLVISPTETGRFTHATAPVGATDAPGHVELWHSRLASAPATEGGAPDERDRLRRVVRAVWARDRDATDGDWKTLTANGDEHPQLQHPATPAAAKPFLGSLDGLDRHMLVRQSSETWDVKGKKIAPLPIGADALWLSTLGAWLDLRGVWKTIDYSAGGVQSIQSWDHRATMGRDQFVRVAYPGYLYPYGIKAALVKVTERKMKARSPSYAALYQRMFLVLGQPVRRYTDRRFPFSRVEVGPHVSPAIDFPGAGSLGPNGITEGISTWIWPKVGGDDFRWTINADDHDGKPVALHHPLLWVNEAAHPLTAIDEHYLKSLQRRVDAHGQSIAFVPRDPEHPDAAVETQRLYLGGRAGLGTSAPHLTAAEVSLPAVQRIGGDLPPLPIAYRQEYLDQGLQGPEVRGVWAVVRDKKQDGEANVAKASADPVAEDLQTISFGTPNASNARAGGFISPSLPIRALSARSGPVGDIQSAVADALDPQAFLKDALPKLFGTVNLADLISGGGPLPELVTEALGPLPGLVRDIEALAAHVARAADEAKALLQRAQAKNPQANEDDALVKHAVRTLERQQAAAASLTALVTAVTGLITDGFLSPVGRTEAELQAWVGMFTKAAADVPKAVDDLAALLAPLSRGQLSRLVRSLQSFLAQDALEDALKDARNLVEKQELSFRFDWSPPLRDWPEDLPFFTLDDRGPLDHLVLSVSGRVSARGRAEVSIAAELRDFSLTLVGEKPLIRVPFDHLSFKAGSSGKPEIDVVLGDLEFLGPLSFVDVIRRLVPFDGFSDPPYMEVSPDGAKAGFTLALPSVAIGIFNLSNLSLGADVRIPFLGEHVSVGFNFCSRERPFSLSVMCLGGGGWFVIRIAPDGLDLLEIGLEATASLSVDLGVASGSVSVAIGIYLRLEGEKGSLTGYFRMRGEVEVLGLASASIELYLELIYVPKTGKMVGRATITVTVEVALFSGSVSVTAERQFAGSNGDPSFGEVLGIERGERSSPVWSAYAGAFAGEH